MKVILPLFIGLASLAFAILPNIETKRFRYSATLWPRVVCACAAAYYLIAAYGAFMA